MATEEQANIKRKAWLCVFIGCGLFWFIVAAVIYWVWVG
ncbi:YmiA family putative membrane protein [Serratia entomophila]|uniref:YmiA family putative membrane protein n=1 Tax=Serratia entomophila TaxID=42906 RepID=A0ABY5CRS9_9GAMM|nr:YmiA family putative membrane protein [Serratia entomophila]USV00111.1 YmiA family putative membrane protein [Serratia entomophila]